ncbi:MAG: aspartate aminotransferase family protein [Parcubacteria group bacterium]|nr:aspartate aminotransferase family protein [Parcubacteria group bacterium]
MRVAEDCVVRSTWHPRLVIAGAKGVFKFDAGVNSFLDFESGPGAANLGWNHPEILEVVESAHLANRPGPGAMEYLNPDFIRLALKFRSVMPQPETWQWMLGGFNSGAEAVSNAIILSFNRHHRDSSGRGRTTLLSFVGDFHGRMYGREVTSSKPEHVEGVPRGIPTLYLPFPARSIVDPNMRGIADPRQYMALARHMLRPFLSTISAIVFECIQGEGGINIAHKDTLPLLISYLREHGVHVIVDEVQTGFGRTGKLWAFEHYGIVPDIMATAKAAGNGYLASGFTVLQKGFNPDKTRVVSTTMGGNALASAVCLKVLEIIVRDYLDEHAAEMGGYLRQRLYQKLRERFEAKWNFRWAKMLIDTMDGMGLMQRVLFVDPQDYSRTLPALRDKVIEEAEKRRLLLMGAGEAAIRIMPPLVVTKGQIDLFVDIFVDSFGAALNS